MPNTRLPDNDKLKSLFCLIILCCSFLMPTNVMADNYDPNNYRPKNDSMKIGTTNLPIVFIDTRCGGDTTKIIHKDWRIAARMKIINNPDGTNYSDTIAHPSQTVDYEGWIAIRYRGNSSFNDTNPDSWLYKKAYNFKTMSTADVNGDKRKTQLLGMPSDHTWVLLAHYADRSLIRDVLMFQLARPYFEYTPRCRYCEMVLDGVYYGLFVMAETIRKGKYRLNLDDPGLSGDDLTGGYQLQIDRNDEPYYYTSKHLAQDSLGREYSAYNKIYFQYKHPEYEEMAPQQLEYIHRQIDLMEDVLASEEFADSTTGYHKYIDPMSFIDQQLSQEVSGNIDGYRLSTNIYKRCDSQDGRFKTTLWDFNLAFGNTSVANARGTDFWRYQNSYLTNYNATNKVPFWWMRLMEDPAYVVKLKERWAQYRRENYSSEHIEATIDSITTLLHKGGAAERNVTLWEMFITSTHEMMVDQLKTWLHKRIAWMDEQLDYKPSDAGMDVMMANAHLNKEITGIYNLRGQRLDYPNRGVVVVRFKDGTSAKIVVDGRQTIVGKNK